MPVLPTPQLDRRDKRRLLLFLSRRRYPRVFLDVDWFIESEGCSSMGRGLEISPRGAHLAVPRTSDLAANVTLFVSLPGRARLFKAKGRASPRSGAKGWVIRFQDVCAEDLTLLGKALIEEAGLEALPGLDRKYQRFTSLHRRHLRTSL